MCASPLWPEHGRWLKDLEGVVDIGLHLTLVDEAPLTAMPRMAPEGRLPSIGRLIVKSYAGTLALEEIAAEMDAQVFAFTQVMGRAPDHIDGHQHAHVLPGIREIVLERARALSPRPWLRNVHDSLGAISRRGVAMPKAGDPRAAWDRQRAVEYEFLAGPGFGAFLAGHGLKIARFAGA